MGRTRYFGTDGIRGVAGQPPLTSGLVLRLGRAIAKYHPGLTVIGADTRRSSPALRSAIGAGLLMEGADVLNIGVLPTPAIAGEVLRRGAATGVAITASHNPFQDNGIKLFGADGNKLDDEHELRLERALEEIDVDEPGPVGTWSEDIPGARQAYLASLRPERQFSLGLHVLVDAANGAASPVAASALEATGARVSALSVEPDGSNINEGCGALHPQRLCDRVKAGDADLGVALDGDADRCLMVDENGQLVDGDVLIALLAIHRRLPAVVGTVMTNEGVVRHLAGLGVELHRANVGDRNVLQMMRQRDILLGGESSGHVIQLDRGPAGDGLATALAVLELRDVAGRTLAEMAAEVPRYPSELRAVRVREKVPLDELTELTRAVEAAQARLANAGRTLIRYSGTEPVLRVFVEGADAALVHELCGSLAENARQLLGSEEE